VPLAVLTGECRKLPPVRGLRAVPAVEWPVAAVGRWKLPPVCGRVVGVVPGRRKLPPAAGRVVGVVPGRRKLPPVDGRTCGVVVVGRRKLPPGALVELFDGRTVWRAEGVDRVGVDGREVGRDPPVGRVVELCVGPVRGWFPPLFL